MSPKRDRCRLNCMPNSVKDKEDKLPPKKNRASQNTQGETSNFSGPFLNGREIIRRPTSFKKKSKSNADFQKRKKNEEDKE